MTFDNSVSQQVVRVPQGYLLLPNGSQNCVFNLFCRSMVCNSGVQLDVFANHICGYLETRIAPPQLICSIPIHKLYIIKNQWEMNQQSLSLCK
jgi:hypothetical protein